MATKARASKRRVKKTKALTKDLAISATDKELGGYYRQIYEQGRPLSVFAAKKLFSRFNDAKGDLLTLEKALRASITLYNQIYIFSHKAASKGA